MKAHAEKFRRLELPVDDPRSGMTRKAILVIEGCGTPMLDKLGHRDDRAVIEAIFSQPRENRIDAIQPFDNGIPRPVELGTISHEALEEVMMRVDEARIDEMPGRIDDLGTLRNLLRKVRPNRRDGTVLAQDVLIADGRIIGGGHDGVAGFQKDDAHAGSASSCKR